MVEGVEGIRAYVLLSIGRLSCKILKVRLTWKQGIGSMLQSLKIPWCLIILRVEALSFLQSLNLWPRYRGLRYLVSQSLQISRKKRMVMKPPISKSLSMLQPNNMKMRDLKYFQLSSLTEALSIPVCLAKQTHSHSLSWTSITRGTFWVCHS